MSLAIKASFFSPDFLKLKISAWEKENKAVSMEEKKLDKRINPANARVSSIKRYWY